MQSTGSYRPRAILAVAVVVLVVATTAGLGTAAQQTPDNNTTVQHERPDEVSERGDTERVRQWLEGRLSRQLGESAVNISQGQYEQGKRLLGDDYSARLDQYVSVAGETESGADDRATETYREARQNQQEYANATQEYRETYRAYERARERGNTTAARQAARELQTLSERVERLNSTLQGEYVALSNQTGADLERPRGALAETTANVSSQQAAVRDQTFVATDLTVRTNASTVSFSSPATVSGQLRLANGTALANATGRLVVADRSYAITTDSDGRFARQYRPVSLPANATSVSVQFVPEATSVYLGAGSNVSVTVRQVSPTIELTETPTTGGFGDPLTTTAVATVDGRPVPSLPIRARLGDTAVSGRTDDSGRVTLSPRVPAPLASGERSLRVAHDRSGAAVGPEATETAVTVTETATNLTLSARHDGRLTVRGRLRTADGDGIGDRQVRLSVGEINRSVTTNETGWYRLTVANASGIDGASAGRADVTARFDGSGTNLRDSRAETAVTLPSAESGGDSLTSLLVGGVVVGVLVVAAVVLWSRRQGGAGSTETAPQATASTDAATAAGPDQSVQWLDRARSALTAGEDERAIAAAYAAVRRHLEREASLPSTLTHRAFVAAGAVDLSVADTDSLSTVATAYERATFLGELDSEAAQESVDAAAALLAEDDD